MKRCAFACAFPSTRRACAEQQALSGALWLALEAAALAATPHEGGCPTAADVRWVLDLLAAQFL